MGQAQLTDVDVDSYQDSRHVTVYPLTEADTHDAPGLISEAVPCIAAVIDDGVVGGEHAVGQPGVAQELPDVLDRLEQQSWSSLRALGRAWDDGDIRRHDQTLGDVPRGLIQQQCAMLARRDPLGDLGQMQAHPFGVAPGQNEARRGPCRRADRAEDVGRCRALVLGCRRPGAAPGSAAGDLVLLADAVDRLRRSTIGEPDLYAVGADTLRAADRVQTRGEAFLKVSMAPAAWAWWRGRAESRR